MTTRDFWLELECGHRVAYTLEVRGGSFPVIFACPVCHAERRVVRIVDRVPEQNDDAEFSSLGVANWLGRPLVTRPLMEALVREIERTLAGVIGLGYTTRGSS